MRCRAHARPRAVAPDSPPAGSRTCRGVCLARAPRVNPVSAFLRRNAVRLAALWEVEARAQLPALAGLTRPMLIDHLPALVEGPRRVPRWRYRAGGPRVQHAGGRARAAAPRLRRGARDADQGVHDAARAAA